MGGAAMIQNCPDCGSKRFKTLGIEKSQRLGDSCVVLISRYGCKDCECEFREFMVTH
jgi:transposase-like protein